MQMPLVWTPATRTVTQVTQEIREHLQGNFSGIWITGEVTECKLASSGHWYFSLKDAGAKISCACFKGSAFRLKVKPQDGLLVQARGSIDVYEPRGVYQFIVEAIEPQGLGALQLAFEKLKQKLAAEGLFATERKRPLPKHPRRIGLVTSPDGAVIEDMLNVLTRRFPGLHIRLYPAQVQGPGAAAQIAEGVRYFSGSGWADVVIVGRGGGSLEDLWAFNEEIVARAIFESAVPIISAVGHETDFTIADFVADLRAPTPSAAAELVIGTRQELLERLAADYRRLERLLRYRLSQASERLNRQGIDRARAVIERRLRRHGQRTDELESALRERIRRHLLARRERHQKLEARLARTDLRLRFAEAHRRLDAATRRLQELVTAGLTRAEHRRAHLAGQLQHLSPLAILERGYAIVEGEAGIVKHAANVAVGADLRIRLANGRVAARVTGKL
ncbi:MAG: exodeoxyribonuclease VII large subunit [Bryobacteraceae bacterium]|nr:exodeoxyribonuclease VII large subunit [Bryobacteraceae bacterium]